MRRTRSASPSWRYITLPVLTPSIMDIVREDLKSNNTKFAFGDVLGNSCCPLHCLAVITKIDITEARLACTGDFETSRNHLLSVLQTSLRKNRHSKWFDLNWRGTNLCTTAFCWMYKISEKKLYTMQESIIRGETHSIHGNLFSSKADTKLSVDKAKVEQWLHAQAQYHPVTGKMFVDSRLPARIIGQQCGVSSVTRVRRIMRMNRKTVMRAKGTLMTRCYICSKLKCFMRRGGMTKEEGRTLMESHMRDVKNEREVVNANYAKSLSDDDCLFISIDDMSNHATKLPNLRDCRSKRISDCDLVRADLSGAVLAKKYADSNYTVDLFLDVGNLYGAGANSVINFLTASLKRMKKLPAFLFIQVDGSRCNKNRVLFMFLSYLVEKRLFNKITVMFLPVGHSHAFADRFFGVIRKKINETDQFTPSELSTAISECKGVRSIRHDRINFNFKKWIENQCGKELDGVFKLMHFEFERMGGKNLLTCRPKASSCEAAIKKELPSLSEEPKWFHRSADTSAFDSLIEVADGEFPPNVIEEWKSARERVLRLPAPVRWSSILDQLQSKKSDRVEDEEELQQHDQKKLQDFMNSTTKSRKRKQKNDDE